MDRERRRYETSLMIWQRFVVINSWLSTTTTTKPKGGLLELCLFYIQHIERESYKSFNCLQLELRGCCGWLSLAGR